MVLVNYFMNRDFCKDDTPIVLMHTKVKEIKNSSSIFRGLLLPEIGIRI
jgi:hypothetical protein